MNSKLLKPFIWLCLILIQLTSFQALAKGGSMVGGGGDGSEDQFNEIRADLLKWINLGGAKELKLPTDISIGEYLDKMTNILENKVVVIGFTDQDVLVNNVKKTCKGFNSEIDYKLHIECNISRFNATPEAEKYRLVHHEYAGLVGIEKNDDAASDYGISNQITDFLTEQTVLKLAVRKAKNINCNVSLNIEYGLIIDSNIKLMLSQILKNKGYTFAKDRADIDIFLFQSGASAKRSKFCGLFSDSKSCIALYATAAINFKTKDFLSLPILKAQNERILQTVEKSNADSSTPLELIGLSSVELSNDFLSLLQEVPSCEDVNRMRSHCEIISGSKVCNDFKIK